MTQFRNYTELDLSFSPGINCLCGPNGSGKTNVLDALHYLAFTRGFRSKQDKQAVQEGNDFFFIGADLSREGAKRSLQCNFVKGKGKKVIVNQRPLAKMSEHIGEVPMVVILPGDTELINGPSADRRRLLDMLISQYSRSYLTHLIQYERLLAQRNAQLKLFAEHRTFDVEQLSIWTSQLVPHGMAIYAERAAFVEEFLPMFEKHFRKIVSEREKPHLRYRSQVTENTIDGWLELFENNLEKDRVNLYTGQGIHRDDLVFSIDGHSVKHYGSQGQQKTFVIALKLAQYQLLQIHKGFAPIMLLDDIFDKLDEHRLGSIARMLDREISGQIFVTDTSGERLGEIFEKNEREVRFFSVKDGEAKRD